MKRLAAVAAAVGVLTASCSGARSVGSLLPSSGIEAGGTTSPSAMGARTMRDLTSTTTAPAGWANTATKAYALTNASDLGALAASQSVTVRLGLQLHNVDGLKQAVQSGAVMSPAQIKSSYGPTATEVAAVSSYLQSQGLGSVTVEPNNLLVSATGTAAQVSKAFNTTLHGFTLRGKNVYANVAPAYVPTALNGIVVAVLGLNNAPAYKAKVRKIGQQIRTPVPVGGTTTEGLPAQQPESPCALSSLFILGFPTPEPVPSPVAGTAGCLRAYTPSDYWRAYDATGAKGGNGVTIGVMAEGNVSQSISDFQVNEQGLALAPVPVVVKQVGVPSTDTAGADEWTLDMTASSGMARHVKTIYLYDAPSLADVDIALMYNRWVTDDLAQIGNSSFGGCEYSPYLDGSMLVDDEIILEGAAQGQTMFASSGDTGSFCSVGTPNGVPAGLPMTEYPASSPYVVAVGGTTLDTTPEGAYQGEAAWDAGGGGLSQFEYSPYWQNGTQPASSTPVGFTFRGVPDMAMDGDLQTGMQIYTTSTGWTVIGGTSLSSPLAAGVWARMLHNHPTLGYAAPLLYKAYAKTAAGPNSTTVPPTGSHGPYHDIITGANGAYSALPGYDYTTGIGSVDVDALSAIIGQ